MTNIYDIFKIESPIELASLDDLIDENWTFASSADTNQTYKHVNLNRTYNSANQFVDLLLLTDANLRLYHPSTIKFTHFNQKLLVVHSLKLSVLWYWCVSLVP